MIDAYTAIHNAAAAVIFISKHPLQQAVLVVCQHGGLCIIAHSNLLYSRIVVPSVL